MSQSLIQEPYETHSIFFKKLTRKKLNELLNRVSTGYLQNQINKVLSGYTTYIKFDKDTCTDIYIKFLSNNKHNIGHISIHFDNPNKIIT